MTSGQHRPPRRLARAGALAVLLVAGPLAACGSNPDRVIVLGFDGLDAIEVDTLISEGQLPNLARLRRLGAYGQLSSREPLLAPVVWTTIATGKTPGEHGVEPALLPATPGTAPVTSELRTVETLWSMVSGYHRRVAVVGWWGTWPLEPVHGVVVSERACHHLGSEEIPAGPAPGFTHPARLAGRVSSLIRSPEAVARELRTRFSDDAALASSRSPAGALRGLGWALATLESYREIGLELWEAERPELLMVYIESVDALARLFGHLSHDPQHDDEEGGSGIMREGYRLVDAAVGEFVERADQHTTLVVASGYGFELGLPRPPGHEPEGWSEPRRRPGGVLYLYGNRIRAGARLEQPRAVDVTPTVLALMGLPPALDMPGRVLTEGLEPPVSVARVYSYETEPSGRAGAAARFRSGEYQAAERIYRGLLDQTPDRAEIHASLGGVLGAQGRFDEATRHLERALELDPLCVQAYHNRGVVLEKLGDAGALAYYREALRLDPEHAPSRIALQRAGGLPAAAAPEQGPPLALVQAAGRAARRGDLAEASRLLDEAGRLDPDQPLLLQYRANLAYLSGDLSAAARALERGLELEPGNVLFAHNLERVRRRMAGARP